MPEDYFKMFNKVQHPFLEHKLTVLRSRETGTKEFRELASEITMLLTYEALKNLETHTVEIETPLQKTTGKVVQGKIIIVPILRAGVGMLDGMLRLIPEAKIGFVGLYRDPETKQPVEYYEKFPSVPEDDARVVIVDPMLATGGSIIATIELVKKKGYKHIKVITIISSPEGIKTVEEAHPDVEIYSGSVDERLDDNKYIVPGLGDAGDRLFGTK